MDWAFQSATRLARAVREREISARDLLEYFLDRVSRFNPLINAIVVQDFERARARAAEADKALARGEVWGALHGVPITVKESFDVSGLPTTWGAPALRDNIAVSHASAVQSLLDAGAVLFGKSNVPYMLGDWQTYNAIYGTTNNPWDLARVPGGSSGGSAAAIAAGLTTFEIGSDIASSIRNPAHYCGIYGHKPSFGIVPQAGHAIPAAQLSLDMLVCGPLARSAEDIALVMDLIVSPEPSDVAGWRIELPAPVKTRLGDYRVGIMLESPECRVDATAANALMRYAERLRAAGAFVDQNARPQIDFSAAHALFLQLLRGATGAVQDEEAFAAIQKDAAGLAKDDRSYRARYTRGCVQLHREWFAAHQERHRIRAAWAPFFEDYDLFLCPAAASAAFPHDQDTPRYDRRIAVDDTTIDYADQYFWAGPASLSYLPATLMPAGLTSTGLPVGLQVIGPYLQDRTTIEFARLAAGEIGGFVPPPKFAIAGDRRSLD